MYEFGDEELEESRYNGVDAEAARARRVLRNAIFKMLAAKLQYVVAVNQLCRGVVLNISVGKVAVVVAAARGGTAVIEDVQRGRKQHVAGRPGLNMLFENAARQEVSVVWRQPADKIQIDHVHGHVAAPELEVVSHLVLDILTDN